ncbi:hypothetical protein BDV11DRAFT_185460 [Aspergillus similis]
MWSPRTLIMVQLLYPGLHRMDIRELSSCSLRQGRRMWSPKMLSMVKLLYPGQHKKDTTELWSCFLILERWM